MKGLLLFFVLLFPICAMAQIEVVNESLICISNSSVLDVKKVNYLKFKNLPTDAVITVSQGMIKPDPKDKSRFYISGKKDMEGRSLKLNISSKGKTVFTKDYEFKHYYDYIDTMITFGEMPIRVGNVRGASIELKNINLKIKNTCKEVLLQNPLLYSLCDDLSIIEFDVSFLQKGKNEIGPTTVQGNNIIYGFDEVFNNNNLPLRIFIENIKISSKEYGKRILAGLIILDVSEDCTPNFN